MSEPVRIPARGDAFPLAGELFLPLRPPRGAVLIAPAMAVRARFYAQLAQFIAEQGAAALVFDYRGIGGSRPEGSMRGFHATFHDWGERDLAGAVDLLSSRFPGVPLFWLGHSAGAQLMGLVPDAPIRGALFVAAGTAYWRAYRGKGLAVMASLWFGVLPVVTALAGYLPMSRMGQGGDDVPLGVAREWCKWGRDPRYVYSYAEPRGGLGYTAYTGPLRAYAIADDTYAPPTAVEHLLSLYKAARKELRTLQPDGRPIGHFGFFRRRDLWDEPIRWLLDAR
jgi:predicted alpha/beta hydrolase